MTEDEMKAKLEELSTSIKALETKNKELLAEKKKAREEADTAREAAEEIAEAKAREAKDVDAIEKRLNEKHAKELAKRDEAISKLTGDVTTFKIDNAIRENLSKHGFDPIHHDLLFDAMKAKAKLDGADGMIGDVSIEEHISTLASSDTGKRYMPAPANAGASALGNKAHGQSVPDAWNLTAYVAMKGENPEGAKAYAEKHGKTF